MIPTLGLLLLLSASVDLGTATSLCPPRELHPQEGCVALRRALAEGTSRTLAITREQSQRCALNEGRPLRTDECPITLGQQRGRFTNCSLSGMVIDDLTIIGGHIADSDLQGASLRNAVLRDVTLTNVNLSRADLTGALLVDVRMEHVNLSTALIADASLRAVTCRDCLWQDVVVRNSRLYDVDLRNARMERLRSERSEWWRVSLEGASLVDAELCAGTELKDSDFRNVNASRIRLVDSALTSSLIDDRTSFVGALFHRPGLFGVRLTSVDLRQVIWTMPPELRPPDHATFGHGDSAYVATLTLYRFLAGSYKESGNFELAREFHFLAENLEAASLGVVGTIRWVALGLTFGYGARPWRLLACAAAIVVACALAYLPHVRGNAPWLENVPLRSSKLFGLPKAVAVSAYLLLQCLVVLVPRDPEIAPRFVLLKERKPEGMTYLLACVEMLLGLYLGVLFLTWLGSAIARLP